ERSMKRLVGKKKTFGVITLGFVGMSFWKVWVGTWGLAEVFIYGTVYLSMCALWYKALKPVLGDVFEEMSSIMQQKR
nr:hypothetical protein [Candidatus Magasanikbacteria bacterium]